ncbi:FHA domain-containing protein [Massilia sp. BJB1822]|uniref:FHA domain-containing protein n=1 Tax=Massilia sp. BJB1822 TaxID=2744470 RepID=UPI001592CCED|nr:FHA domain-containing protein [Massilia sp. BJB1822]NVD99792.1 FHA domain-containing protein [Massilia sp. BJB1822]
MAKIIVSRDGVVEQQIQLSKESMSVGRHRHNDIVLNHPAVSGQHALITTILDDSFLEDLHSTNGTFVNGHRIGKHFLQHKDLIKLAKYQIEFLADGIRPLAAAQAASQPAASAPSSAEGPPARIEVLNGSNMGKQLTLLKTLTSLGRPGVQVVVIARAAGGYTISHVEGLAAPLLNGAPLGRAAQRLLPDDVIDLGGTLMAFRLP